MGRLRVICYSLIVASSLGFVGQVASAEEDKLSDGAASVEIEGHLELKVDALLGQTFFQSQNKNGLTNHGFWVTSDREKNSSLKFPNPEIQRRFNIKIFSSSKDNLDPGYAECARVANEALKEQKTLVVSVSGLNAVEMSQIRTGRIVITKGPSGEIIRRRVIELSLNVAKEIEVMCEVE